MPRTLEREYWLTKKAKSYNSTPNDNKLKWVMRTYHTLLLTGFTHECSWHVHGYGLHNV
jgi:hypothetical protein